MENRKARLHAIYEELETNLNLLGVTAVEDRLQEGVPEAMSAMRAAGIRLWVLTGLWATRKAETRIAGF